MGMVEGAIDFVIGEKEGGKYVTKSNFVDDGKCPNISNPKLKTSFNFIFNFRFRVYPNFDWGFS